MMRIARWVAVLALAWSAAAGAAAEPARRVALVIANADYVGRNHLANPSRDAALMKAALAKAGFSVIDAPVDLGHDAFYHALQSFSGRARGAEVAFVYYAGHAIQAGGRNWLIPVDATLESESGLNLQAVDLDTVLSAVEGAKWRVVALDACRNNPFGQHWGARGRAYQGAGLGAVEADNVLVMYAAAANQTASDGVEGEDSPFAVALARRLTQPGLAIQLLGDQVRDDVLAATHQEQRPFVSASISAEPFFFIAAPSLARVVGAPVGGGDSAEAMEMMFWSTVMASNDPAQFKMYLDRYPTGQFAAIARQKMRDAGGREGRAILDRIPQRDWVLKRSNELFSTFIHQGTVTELQRAAEAGDPRAEILMGYARQAGAGGFDADPAEAMRWYRAAADQGDARGLTAVGSLYMMGAGVKRSSAEALVWFRKGADQGSAGAQNNIALVYLMGGDVPQDRPKRSAGCARRPTRARASASSTWARCMRSEPGRRRTTRRRCAGTAWRPTRGWPLARGRSRGC
jgi:hypothetical protein